MDIQETIRKLKASGKIKPHIPRCPNDCYNGLIFYEKDGIRYSKLCQCEIEKRMNNHLLKSGLNPNKTMENFKEKDNMAKEMKRVALKFLKDIGKNPWLCYLGQSGAGKTHIITATVLELIKKGEMVKVVSYVDEFAKLTEHKFSSAEKYRKQLKGLKEAKILVIDDLFKKLVMNNQRDLYIQEVFNIIDYRYNNYLMTIISSEYDLASLLDIDQAIAGRIKEMSEGYRIQISEDISKNRRL